MNYSAMSPNGVPIRLTDGVNPLDYWFKMRIRVKTEDGLELATICRRLKQRAIN